MVMVLVKDGVIQWSKVEGLALSGCGSDDVPFTLVSLGVSSDDRVDDVAVVLEKIASTVLISTLLVCITFTWEESADERVRVEGAVVDFFKGSERYKHSAVFLRNEVGQFERVIPEHDGGDGEECLRTIIPEGALAR